MCKKILFTSVCVLFFSLNDKSFAQSAVSSAAPKSITKGKIYALIVGITDYKDPNIKDLKFANRDATLFAEYLMSRAGGLVPAENIKLLLDQEATVANIYMSKKWLETTAKKNDVVFFYYAGHGDVESGVYKLGFLLAYDSPYQNYLNNAVRIEDINIMANELSLTKNANVILITDACHSGKLAGSDNRGKNLIGEQLNTVENNEIRIAACEADQLAQEDAIWGGGRGAFSYYLLNGLKGLADNEDSDGIISLKELKEYLEKEIPFTVMQHKEEEQSPVIVGKGLKKLAIVDDSTLQDVKKEILTKVDLSISGDSRSVDNRIVSRYAEFYNTLAKQNLKSMIETEEWNDEGTSVQEFILSQDYLQTPNLSTQSLLELFEKDNAFKTEFNNRLVVKIHNEVQEAINKYLSSDPIELNRRIEVFEGEDEYSEYPVMIDFAMQLIDIKNPLYHILHVKRNYFAGVVARLQWEETTSDENNLLTIAYKEQIKAHTLEPKAAYILNELGIICKYNNQLDSAEFYFKAANEIAPTWALPWANLSSLYFTTKDHGKGIQMGVKAIALNPDVFISNINLAKNYEADGKYLFAEEFYRKGIRLKPDHYYAFDRIGLIMLKKMDYANANLYFKEAYYRKEGLTENAAPKFRLPEMLNTTTNKTTRPDQSGSVTNVIDTSSAILNLYYFADQYFKGGDTKTAKEWVNRILNKDPNNWIAHKLLAEIEYADNDYLEATIAIDNAIRFHLDSLAFEKHTQKLKYNGPNVDKKMKLYRSQYFEKENMYLYYGMVYQQWGNYLKAEEFYNKAKENHKIRTQAFYLLWNLHELYGNMIIAEATIKEFVLHDKSKGLNELKAFYKRALLAKPSEEMLYRLANIVYGERKLNTVHHKQPPFEEMPWLEAEEKVLPKYSNFMLTPKRPKKSYDIDDDIKVVEASIQREDMSSAIDYFNQFVSMSNDSTMLADAYYKLGDLAYWNASKEDAIYNYTEAVQYAPSNSAYRSKLIEINHQFYNYTVAYDHLTTLSEFEQLDINHILLKASYDIYNSNIAIGNEQLKYYQSLSLDSSDQIQNLQAICYTKTKNWSSAQLLLESQLKKQPEMGEIYYSLARITARQGNLEQASEYFKKAIINKFNLKFVFKADPVIDALRKHPEWGKEISGFNR